MTSRRKPLLWPWICWAEASLKARWEKRRLTRTRNMTWARHNCRLALGRWMLKNCGDTLERERPALRKIGRGEGARGRSTRKLSPLGSARLGSHPSRCWHPSTSMLVAPLSSAALCVLPLLLTPPPQAELQGGGAVYDILYRAGWGAAPSSSNK